MFYMVMVKVLTSYYQSPQGQSAKCQLPLCSVSGEAIHAERKLIAGDLTAAVATECLLSESLQAVAKEKATERKAQDCMHEGIDGCMCSG